MSVFIPIPKKSNVKQCSNYQTITLMYESQARIKIAGININNLRYTDDNTLMAESEEELNSLLMMVKEGSEKAEVKFSIQKTKITATGPIISWQIDVSGSGISHLFQNFPQFFVIHIVRGFGIVNKVEVDVSLPFLMIQWMLAV